MASRRKQSKPKSFADVDPITGEPILTTEMTVDSIATIKDILASKSEQTNEETDKTQQETVGSTLKRKRQDEDEPSELTTSMAASSSSSPSSSSVNNLSEEKTNVDNDSRQIIPTRPAKVPATIVEENGENHLVENQNEDVHSNEDSESNGPLSNQIHPNFAHLNNEDDDGIIDEENYDMIDMDPSSSSYNHHYLKDGSVIYDGYGSPMNGDSLALDDDEDDEDDLNDTGDMKQYEEGGQMMSSMLLQFKCKVCGKGFKHRRSLNRHVKLHSGEKNFICPYCTTAFARSDHLKAHIRTHNNSKPYRCPICQCGYSTQAALKVHMAHHHSKSKFKCVLCNNLEFHSQLALEGHIYTKHSKENNDLNDLINETRGRYSQPIKMDYKNDVSYVNGINGNNSDHHLHHHHHMNSNSNNHSNEIHANNTNNLNENHNTDDANSYNNYNRSRLTDINNIKELNTNNESNTNYGKEANTNNSTNNSENNSPSNKQKNMNEQGNRAKSTDDDDDIIIEETISNTSPSSNIKPTNAAGIGASSQPLQKANITPVNNSNGNGVVVNKMTNGGSGGGLLLNQQLKRIAPKIDPSIGIANNHHQPISSSYNSNHINRLLPPSQLPNKTSTAFIGTIRNLYPNVNGDNTNNNNNNNNNGTVGYSSAPSRTLNTTHPQLHSHLNGNGPSPSVGAAPPSSTSSPSTSPNTYCELCNARFSNVESYVAHMRNCHPNIPYNLNAPASSHQNQNTKMPYLTSILSSKSNQMIKSSPNGMNPSAITNGVIIPLNGQSKPASNGPTVCNVPNCNCANSVNTANNQAAMAAAGVHPPYPPPPPHPSHLHHYSSPHDNDMYILKETHYTCVQCSLTFVKLNDYMTHLKHEHCVEVFRCILCKQMQLFDNLNLLKEHFFQVHQSHKYDLFKCKICLTNTRNSTNSVFNNIEDLYAHLSSVHHHNTRANGGPPAIYPGGSNTGSPYNNHHYPHTSSQGPPPPSMLPPSNTTNVAPSNDRFHYLNHPNANNGNKCFKCNYCDSDFAQQNSLNQHIQMVHKINPTSDHHHHHSQHHHQNRFNSAAPVPPHHSLHSQQPPHHQNTNNHLSCQYCRNTFTNRSQLERHLRIHLSSIDLKCNICDRLFETQDSLSQHKLTHCKTYDMDSNQNNSNISNNNVSSTKSTGNLNSSTSSPSSGSNNNSNNSMAICVYCKQTIENEIQFKEHFKRHNNIGIQNQGQNGPNGATKTNSFICIVCRQTLTSNSEYNLHMKHHLRRLNQNSQNFNNKTNISTTVNNSNGAGSIEKAKPIEETVSTSATSGSTNKLKCSKCLVKFEVWQELVEHMSKAHNIRTASSSSLSSSPSPSIKSTTSNSSMPQNEEKEARNHEVIKQEPSTNTPPASKQNSIVTRASSSSAIQGDHLCEICTCKFDTPSKLQSHLLLKHEFPIAANSSSGPLITALVCPVCDESFSRADHLLAHTAVHGQAAKIYKCTHCPMAFVFKSQLINHSFAHQNNNKSQPTTPNSQNKAYNLRSHISPRSIGQSPQFNTTNNIRTTAPITKIAPQLTNVQPNKTHEQHHQQEEQSEIEQNNQNGDFDFNNVEESEVMYSEHEENKNNEGEEELNLEERVGLDEENFVEEANENEKFQADQSEFLPIEEDLQQENSNEEVVHSNEEDMQENLEEAMTKSDSVASNSNKNNVELNDEIVNTNENFNENNIEDFIVNDNDDDIDNLEC